MSNIEEAIEALLAYRQADMEGVIVLTSRQAIHEVADELRRIRSWQPISTAPRDGTHILAHRSPIGIRVTNMTNPPTVVHWFDDADDPGFYTSVNERAPDYPFNPTHWMPLPEPPTPGDPPMNRDERLALADCPLCGAHAETLLRGFYYGHDERLVIPAKKAAVLCPACGCRAPEDRWNERAALRQSSEQDAVVEALSPFAALADHFDPEEVARALDRIASLFHDEKQDAT